MRFLIASDLHNEFVRPAILAGKDDLGPLTPEEADYDAVILAGDTDLGTAGISWASKHFWPKPVIMIAGNHEFYGGRVFLPHYKTMKATGALWDNIHFLEQDVLELDGLRIAGTTLWTDAAKLQPGAETNLNDFHQIYWEPGVLLNIGNWKSYNHKTMRWMRRLTNIDIMITHHAPSYTSVDWGRYNDRSLDPLYASELDYFVDDLGPNLWIHGHMHTSQDYMIGDTRVLTNPRGYVPDYVNPNWDRGLIVEINASEDQLDDHGCSKPEDVGSNPTGGSKPVWEASDDLPQRVGGVPLCEPDHSPRGYGE